MPKGSEELTNARKREIVEACAKLYETMSFKDITLNEIANATSFSRTSIYNYFNTKEEIFLALLGHEYELWDEDLQGILKEHDSMDADGFANALARSLDSRQQMLKLLSMNHYDMEASSSEEDLVEFKRAYGATINSVKECLGKFFPEMGEDGITGFVYAFFPFLFGVYPYTVVTDKQRDVMARAKVNYTYFTPYEIIYMCVKRLLA